MSLKYTIAHLARRYLDRRNVVGIGRGVKRTGGVPTEKGAIIVYVRRKGPPYFTASERIPRWVYDRDRDGAVDRRRRYRTDVRRLAVARATLSGRRVRRPPVRFGAVTLGFDKLAAGGRRTCYILGAGHVIGNVFASRLPSGERIAVSLAEGRVAAGRTVAHTRAWRGVLRFDIALARLDRRLPRSILRRIAGSAEKLSRLRRSQIPIGKAVRVAALRSRRPVRAYVAVKLEAGLPVEFRRGRASEEIEVRNLYELDGFAPRGGDSGALVYAGEEAIGIVVGASESGGLFQPLRPAARYLLERSDEGVDLHDLFGEEG